MSTNTTAFCSRRPTADFQHTTQTLARLVFQFLHELTEGEVRNLFAKEGFHTAKVQVFKEQNIKFWHNSIASFQW